MRPRFTIRALAPFLALLAALGACGEDRDEFATARCKMALRQALGAEAKLAFPDPREAALRDDPVYGWHLDLDVEAKLGTGARPGAPTTAACSWSRTATYPCSWRWWSGDG